QVGIPTLHQALQALRSARSEVLAA
ncbi:type III secretion chaperone SycN, partial [Pseudomonas aeruginosa]|nr:type III secretion chaperone SycN [Pseudomonas aeruginosa]